MSSDMTEDEFSTSPLKDLNISPQENLNLLASCNCCDKHRILRPKKLTSWIETEKNKGLNPNTSNTNPINGLLYCLCDCRHRARFICRNYS